MSTVEQPGNNALRGLRGFVLDLDGVIYRGNAVLPGAVETLSRLRAGGIPFLFLTNNSTTTPPLVAERLRGMGIPADADEVITSSVAAAGALAAEMPGCRVFVVGEAGIREALLEVGLRPTDRHGEADAVLVGLDRECTYARMRDAALAIRRGALFVATNTDRTLPTEEGFIPGAGALVGALQIATDVDPRVMGKPSREIFEFALRRLGAEADHTAAVGDRPETDIIGAQHAGMRTIAVLTGAGTADSFAALRPPPDWVFRDLMEFRLAYFED